VSTDELHQGFADDAGAYVLGALTEAEHVAFVAHLQSCPVCRDEVGALQRVASALPAPVPQLSAPRELKGRVMATVQSESGLREERRAGDAERVSRHRLSSRFGGRSLHASLTAVAAIAVVAIVIASSGGGSPTRVVRAQVTVPRASVSVRLSGGHAELDVRGMPQSPPQHVYEVWIKRAGRPEPTDALFTVSSAGTATVGVPGSTKGVKQIMVTAEPRGGSLAPTSAPVIVASL
jgi:anti-sigma-K factor RskA